MKIYNWSILVVTLVLSNFAFAATISWDAGGDGISWTDAGNWSGTTPVVPGSGDTATINGTATGHNVKIATGVSAACTTIRVAGLGASNIATLTIESGASLTTSTAVRLAEGSGGGTGTINVYGNFGGGATAFQVGHNGVATAIGTINQYSGTVTGGNWLMGYGVASTGTYNMDGGTVNVGTAQFGKASNAKGYLYMSAGTVNTASFELAVGTGSTGEVHLDGGTINSTNLVFGVGTASMDITGTGKMIVDFTYVDGFETWEQFKTRINGLGITGYDLTTNVIRAYDDVNTKVTITAIPEPATLFLLGLGGLLFARRK